MYIYEVNVVVHLFYLRVFPENKHPQLSFYASDRLVTRLSPFNDAIRYTSGQRGLAPATENIPRDYASFFLKQFNKLCRYN